MFVNNIIQKSIIVPGAPNFVEVEVFDWTFKEDAETGVRTTTIANKGKQYINMALVASIKQETLKETTHQLTRGFRSSEGYDWVWDDAAVKTEVVTNTVEVFKLRTMHEDVKINDSRTIFVKFVAKE